MSAFKPARRNTGAVYGYTAADYYNEVQQSIPTEPKKQSKKIFPTNAKTPIINADLENEIKKLFTQNQALINENKTIRNYSSDISQQLEDAKLKIDQLERTGAPAKVNETQLRDLKILINDLKIVTKQEKDKNGALESEKLSLIERISLLEKENEDLKKVHTNADHAQALATITTLETKINELKALKKNEDDEFNQMRKKCIQLEREYNEISKFSPTLEDINSNKYSKTYYVLLTEARTNKDFLNKAQTKEQECRNTYNQLLFAYNKIKAKRYSLENSSFVGTGSADQNKVYEAIKEIIDENLPDDEFEEKIVDDDTSLLITDTDEKKTYKKLKKILEEYLESGVKISYLEQQLKSFPSPGPAAITEDVIKNSEVYKNREKYFEDELKSSISEYSKKYDGLRDEIDELEKKNIELKKKLEVFNKTSEILSNPDEKTQVEGLTEIINDLNKTPEEIEQQKLEEIKTEIENNHKEPKYTSAYFADNDLNSLSLSTDKNDLTTQNTKLFEIQEVGHNAEFDQEYDSFPIDKNTVFTLNTEGEAEELTLEGFRTDKFVDAENISKVMYNRFNYNELDKYLYVQGISTKNNLEHLFYTPIVAFGYRPGNEDYDFVVITEYRSRGTLDQFLAKCLNDISISSETTKKIMQLFNYVCFEIGKVLEQLNKLNITVYDLRLYHFSVRDKIHDYNNPFTSPTTKVYEPFELEINYFGDAFINIEDRTQAVREFNSIYDPVYCLLHLFNAFSAKTIETINGNDGNYNIQGALNSLFYENEEVSKKLNDLVFVQMLNEKKNKLFPGKLSQVANVLLSYNDEWRAEIDLRAWATVKKNVITEHKIMRTLMSVFNNYSYESLLKDEYTLITTGSVKQNTFDEFTNVNFKTLDSSIEEDDKIIKQIIKLLKDFDIIMKKSISAFSTIDVTVTTFVKTV